MQLRKLTTAMLVMGLSAALRTQKMARLPLVAPWTRSLKMA
ncbi:Uncharacterised protein [Salmonella enterica subsp. enterica]|uniref:Uncharacterized protein n=1 Tax=Salmonella enterica I TaxID=59201 RepID=A0A379WDQ1_SALET|nr:Uncharacterised protein [Salmonella enterica subsp. enterica]VDZ95253.1 Uncharacterised protein [Salmonella enterica subsp. enterica]